MATVVADLLRHAHEDRLDELATQLASWADDGFPDLGLRQAFREIPSPRDRAQTALGLTQIAAADGYPSLITALADTEDPVLLTSLAEPHPEDHFTPAQRAAHHGWANVITALAETLNRAVLDSLAAPHAIDGLTPAQRAAILGWAHVIAALAATRDPAVLTSLTATHPVHQLNPARSAAQQSHDAVITLAATRDPDVLASLAEPHPDTGLTPAQRAAQGNRGDVIRALAETLDPAVLASLAAANLQDGYTPAQRAASLNGGDVIEALAGTQNPCVLDSLVEPHPKDGDTPAQRATRLGHSSALQALADTGEEAVLASLAAEMPGEGITLEAWARRTSVEAGVAGQAHAMQRYATAADALHGAISIPADEPQIMKRACADLESIPGGLGSDLLNDLHCTVSFVPFTSAGPGRPVHLVFEDQTVGRACMAERTKRRLSEPEPSPSDGFPQEEIFTPVLRQDPFTRKTFIGFQEAWSRQTLVRAVVDAYRQHPSDLAAARRISLAQHGGFERSVVEQQQATEWATLLRDSAQATTASRGSFESILSGAMSGTGAGAGRSRTPSL